jgi:peptidoglycan/LPS O-acetylase OafA/YrhL
MLRTTPLSADSLAWRNPRLTGRIPELDGIRGLAILLVLVWHYFVSVGAPAPHSWQAYLLATLSLTWSGVDLFFVLSGFLIGGILYDAKDSLNYFRTFYSRRIHRIFPIYFLWIALFMTGLYLVGPNSPGPLRQIFNRNIPVWTYPLFLQNFSIAWQQTTFEPIWMGVTWSLAVEEQFYCLLPLLVRNLSYRGIIWMATASIFCAPLVRLILWSSGNHYFGPYTLLPCRADALGFGVLLALACRNKRAWEWLASHRRNLYWAFLLLGCGMAFLLKYQNFLYVFGLSWIAAFYASLLLLTVVNPGRMEITCFRSRILMALGTVAYAVYILHQGVNALFHFAILGRVPGNSTWSAISVTFLSLTAVMLLSALSWRLLEKPLIRRAQVCYRY